jgi:HEAT repeat protein
MNFLTALQADRLIAQIREEPDPTSATGKQLFAKLGKLGTAAIPKILEALASSDKRQTAEYVEILSSLTSDKTLPLVTRGFADSDPRTVSATAWALSSNKRFNINRLVDLLGEDEYSKAATRSASTSASCSARFITCSRARRPQFSSSSTKLRPRRWSPTSSCAWTARTRSSRRI